MPTYIVTAPDGKEYEVDAPQGASEADALTYFKKNWTPEQKSKKATYAETAEEMPWYQQMAAGAGGAVQGLYLGAKQLADKASEEEVADYQAAMSGLRGTGAGIVGEIFANVLPGMGVFKAASTVPKVATALGSGGLKAGATVAGLSGATGALEGALTPVTQDQSRIGNVVIGGTVGAVAPAVVGGVTRGAQIAKNLTSPFFSKEARQISGGQMLRDVSGGKTDEILSLLENARPGQTAGQATVSANVPEFAAMQRIASDVAPNAPYNRELAQRASRQAEIRSFAGTQDDLDKAIRTRGNQADANYVKAFQSAVKWDSELGSIMKNPYVKDALPEVRKLVQAEQGKRSVPLGEQLQMVKKELDGMLKNKEISDNKSRAILDAQSSLTDWMKRKLTGYDVAIEEYAKASADIAQRKAGLKAMDILQSDVGSRERAGQLAKAVAEERGLLRASGALRGSSLENVLEPANMVKLNNIVDELNIDANFKELASAGMKSEKVARAVSGAVELPHLLNNAVVLMNNAVRRFAGGGKIKTLQELSEVMQDPAMTAKIMRDATIKEKNAMKFLIKAQQAGALGSQAIVGTQQ